MTCEVAWSSQEGHCSRDKGRRLPASPLPASPLPAPAPTEVTTSCRHLGREVAFITTSRHRPPQERPGQARLLVALSWRGAIQDTEGGQRVDAPADRAHPRTRIPPGSEKGAALAGAEPATCTPGPPGLSVHVARAQRSHQRLPRPLKSPASPPSSSFSFTLCTCTTHGDGHLSPSTGHPDPVELALNGTMAGASPCPRVTTLSPTAPHLLPLPATESSTEHRARLSAHMSPPAQPDPGVPGSPRAEAGPRAAGSRWGRVWCGWCPGGGQCLLVSGASLPQTG
uniref:proline-rich protein 18 n=1 Tax=Ictidomys tridecemlineatus TaxID=43179 RepID=UPI001A9DB5B9|nr:proline-rich protein 18 [Ictidomys tridecemlineatus]